MSGEILVIGGKGKTGRRVAQRLAERGIPHRIGTRTPSAPSEVAFDWMRTDIARDAFTGISAVYIVAPTNSSDHGAIVPPVLDIALASGVRRFVLLSASSLESGGPMMGLIHAYLKQNTKEWCVLRPTWFMQNFSEQQHLATIRNENTIYSATNNGRVGFIDACDIADAAVSALLADTSWNRDIILTGPETLSYAEVAASLSAALGRLIRHVNLTYDELAERHRRLGMEDRYASMLAALDIGIAQGREDRITNGIIEMTCHSATPLDRFIQRELSCWQTA